MAREMKDSGVAWIGEIPVDWGKNKIIRIFEIIGSGTTPKANDEQNFDGKVYWIQSGDITGNYILTAKNKISEATIEKYSALKIYSAPFVVVAMYGASIGNLAISNICACVNQACCVLKNSNIDFQFSYYTLQAAQSYLVRQGIGGGQPNISQEIIKQLWIPVPPQDEQKQISSFLDKKCAEIDAVLAKTRSSIEEYKKLKQAIITQAVTKGVRGDRPMKESGIEWMGSCPADWTIIKIKWLLEEGKDRSIEGTEEPLSMSQKYGILPTREMDLVPNMASSFVGAKLVHKGDLVFNKLKAHLGVFAVSGYDGLVSPDYAVYRTTNLANAAFLEYLFKTPRYISEFKKNSTGIAAGLTRLYTDGLYSIFCALPSLAEQQEIIGYLHEKIVTMDTLIRKKEQFMTELETYKKSLVYEYVTGKKEVKE